MSAKNSCDLVLQLDDCLFFSVTKLARGFGKIGDDAFSKTGLSPSHAFILYLVNCSGPLHQKEIGEKLHLSLSTITRFIEKLESKGLIEKTVDGKNAVISSTEKGLALQEEVAEAWRKLHEQYEDILTEEEVATFIALSEKLLKTIDTF